jgi:hypothetical protein
MTEPRTTLQGTQGHSSSLSLVCAAARLEPRAAATALSRLELRGLVERGVAGYARAATRVAHSLVAFSDLISPAP